MSDTSNYSYLGGHASVGYRLTERGPWVITPFLGYGSNSGRSCFEGHPDQINDVAAGSFAQIAQNPGPETCVRNDRRFVHAALAVDLRVFAMGEGVGGGHA